MKQVTSKDATTIAFDQSGTGPALILVHGAFMHRAMDQQMAQLARFLSPHFTVCHYDRRGRGESGDSQPYDVQREVEDIDALIEEAGGSAFIYGISSGAALAMEAAIKLPGKIKKLAMYEAPFWSDESASQTWKEYRQNLKESLAADRRGDAAGLFLTLVGMPADQLEQMRSQPWFAAMEAVAPTLAYDAAVLGEDRTVPIEKAAKVPVPALVMNGTASEGFMYDTAVALANAMPNTEHRALEGQTHAVTPEAIAPVLVEFFTQ